MPKGKSKNAAVGHDGKNCVPLVDIGNHITTRAPIAEGKLLPQISRPITSFGAEIVTHAHAQAVAAAANKKPAVVIADGAAKRPHFMEVKPKISVKLKPDVVVIDISSDSSEEKKHRSRKKCHTLTYVLTARSKAASGITDVVKEAIPDIDATDVDDQLAVVEYIEDIYKFYRFSENSSKPHDYMDSQVEINAKMRAILADWMIEVHTKFELMPESLYLTFYIIDRYLSMGKVLRKELQLVGVADIRMQKGEYYGSTPELNVWDLPKISRNQFSCGAIQITNNGDGSGPRGQINSIFSSWMVNPGLFGDTRSRLFTYWTADGFQNKGCFNLRCLGFVQVNPSIPLESINSSCKTFLIQFQLTTGANTCLKFSSSRDLLL